MIVEDVTPPSTIQLPMAPAARYRILALYTGLWIIHVTTDSAVEGRVIDLWQPDYTTRHPSPSMILDTMYGQVDRLVRAGDILAVPVAQAS